MVVAKWTSDVISRRNSENKKIVSSIVRRYFCYFYVATAVTTVILHSLFFINMVGQMILVDC